MKTNLSVTHNSKNRVSKTRMQTLSQRAKEVTEGKTGSQRQDLKECLNCIECECGELIVLLPDLNAMNRSIEAHIAQHIRKEKEQGKATVKPTNVRQNLIGQVLKVTSEMPI